MPHSTNYTNTFIQVADDCPIDNAQAPPLKGKRTIPTIQHDLIGNNPYRYTSDDVLFEVFAERNDVPETEYESERIKLFSKGQACLRSSPLAKRYGWGFHFDDKSRVALFGVESDEYQKLLDDKSLKHIKAMRSSKSKK